MTVGRIDPGCIHTLCVPTQDQVCHGPAGQVGRANAIAEVTTRPGQSCGWIIINGRPQRTGNTHRTTPGMGEMDAIEKREETMQGFSHDIEFGFSRIEMENF